MRCELHCSCRRHSVVEVDDAKVREGLDHAEQEEDADRDAVPAQRSGCWLGAAQKSAARCYALVLRRGQLRVNSRCLCARRALCPPPPQAPSPSLRVQGRGGAHCVGSKPFSSTAAGAGVAGVKSMGAGAASSAFSSAFSSIRSLWSLRMPHVPFKGARRCAKSLVRCRGVGHWCARAKRTRAAEPASRDSGSSGRRRQASTLTWHPAAPPSTSARGKSLR